ncbi:hypothetical protein M3664_04970 [Paenibacillus lautus]|uniref:hypothetical protein n=1 Tax=Paenibacillus lautus TaxID=1401 RepID=UPI0020424C8A|nr:hypothetical protein [Paenibacillus lautus]MCM3257135.1 hypothetical protein [Paenibacillus lautus]
MGKKVVIARLRENKDDDLRDALDNMPPYYDESDIVREALRQFFFGHEGRQPVLMGSQVNSKVVVEDAVDIVLERSDEEFDLEGNLDNFIKE